MGKRRRSKGEGSVYQRKDGKWCAQLNGTCKYSTTEDGAKAKLYQMLAGVEENKPENITVSTMVEKWFEYQTPNLKPSTVKRYREAIEIYVKPNLGNYRLHSLTALQVQSLYSKMLKNGLSATTVNLVHSVLSSAYKRAIKWRMVEHSVLSLVDAPRIHRKEVEVSTLQKCKPCSQQRNMTLWKQRMSWHCLPACVGVRFLRYSLKITIVGLAHWRYAEH
jgi:integrase